MPILLNIVINFQIFLKINVSNFYAEVDELWEYLLFAILSFLYNPITL